MTSYVERTRARARLAQTPAPVDNDSLRKIEEEAVAIIREAKQRRSHGSEELLARAVDDVSRSYCQYLMRRHRGRAPPNGNP